ncbi:MAG: hypothetical protein J0H14_05855 [Alphaproteobacteria bacterium]|nr:hypothetical protein [Alphaproteobacteria bacterium]
MISPAISAPGVRFHRLISTAPPPVRADRSAAGTLPTRATRYCDAVTSAAGFGWHVFSPMDLSLYWDGEAVFWTYGDIGEWLPLGAAQFPHFAANFDGFAPPEAQGCSPPFLTALPEPGVVQIWTGLIARTAPGWSLLIRGPANLPPVPGVSPYEGIVETDRWFGPLFINLRLTRTHAPISLNIDTPLAQIQPLPRAAYAEQTLDATSLLDTLAPEDWADYVDTIVRPNDDPDRRQGSYAVAARKRRRGECPFSGARVGAGTAAPLLAG